MNFGGIVNLYEVNKMKMKKTIMMLVLFVILSNMVIAASFYYREGDEIDLKIPCLNNETLCDSSVGCNITINYPNGSSMVSSQPMSLSNSKYNYTLDDSTFLGEYNAMVFCYAHSKAGKGCSNRKRSG